MMTSACIAICPFINPKLKSALPGSFGQRRIRQTVLAAGKLREASFQRFRLDCRLSGHYTRLGVISG
jgi:hypothetical protein